MPYKFEQLDVWKLALNYVDLIYRVAESLPRSEDFNLKSQVTRAATSVALNIAEGSQGQSDAEQARFWEWRFVHSLKRLLASILFGGEAISKMKVCYREPTMTPSYLQSRNIKCVRTFLSMKMMSYSHGYCPSSMVYRLFMRTHE